jgi:hypothetical protein
MRTYELMDKVSPLPLDVEALLQHERVIVEKPEIVRARLVARARESMRFSEVSFPKLVKPSTLRPIWLAAAAGIALMASVALAVQVYRGYESPKPNPPVVLRVPAVVERLPASAPSPSQAPIGRAPTRTDVVEELRFLDRARQADARGDYAAALTLASEHERLFPRGRLAEDREVLRIRALVGLGRSGDARSTSAKFRRQFPRSVLLPKIDALLDGLPPTSRTLRRRQSG